MHCPNCDKNFSTVSGKNLHSKFACLKMSKHKRTLTDDLTAVSIAEANKNSRNSSTPDFKGLEALIDSKMDIFVQNVIYSNLDTTILSTMVSDFLKTVRREDFEYLSEVATGKLRRLQQQFNRDFGTGIADEDDKAFISALSEKTTAISASLLSTAMPSVYKQSTDELTDTLLKYEVHVKAIKFEIASRNLEASTIVLKHLVKILMNID